MTHSKKESARRESLEEPRRTGEVTPASVLVCVGILLFAIVSRYLGQ